MKPQKILPLSAALILLASPFPANAAPAWYAGVVNRVALSSSENPAFVVTLENNQLSDCLHNYAYFSQSKLGEFKFTASYTMALTSKATGQAMGIVIDKAVNGPGGKCLATGMVSDLR